MGELRTKPLFEKEGWEQTTRKFVPTRGAEPRGFAVKTQGKNNAGEKIVVRVKKTRHSVCGIRDVMAKAGAKSARFTQTNANLDNRIDDAPSGGIGIHMPNSYRGKGNGKSRSRLLG